MRTINPATRGEILARYASGWTAEELAAAYGRNRATIQENLHRWGADVRRRGPARIYSLDEHYFDSIDTPEKAYWLGFILADGSVVQSHAGNWWLRAELQRSDSAHLTKLACALSSDVPVRPSKENASYVTFCSATLCASLQAYGIIERKTGVHGTPPIRASLMRHMYRGYFDGDGSLFPMKQCHGWRYEMVGAPGFIHDHRQWLKSKLGLEPTWRCFRRGCVSVLRYDGGRRVETIVNLLYRGATVFLDRKHGRYLELLARPQRAGCRSVA